jgi:hypothetical protein
VALRERAHPPSALRQAPRIPRAENSAVKNTAPCSLTPLKISENASIRSFGLFAKFPGTCTKESAGESRPSKSWRHSGMVVFADPPHNCSPDADVNANQEINK